MWDDIFEDGGDLSTVFIHPRWINLMVDLSLGIGIFGIFIGACFHRRIIISNERSGRHRGSSHRGRKQIFFTDLSPFLFTIAR